MSLRNAKQPPAAILWGRYAILFAVTFTLLALRRPDALTNPQFWAEDGLQFFYPQIAHGTWATLFQPFEGYLQLVPRLVAAGASLFSARLAPLLYNVAALAIATCCCTLFSLPVYRPLLRSDSLRTLLCLLMATAFFADEILGTITNAQWFLFLPALLLLILPAEYYERSPRLEWAAAILVLLIGLSAPLVAILLPLALWVAWRRGRITPVPVSLILVIFIQTGVTLLVPAYDTTPFLLNPGKLAISSVVAFTYRVLLSSVAGHRWAEAGSDGRLVAIAIALLILVIMALIKALRDLGPAERPKFAAAVYLLCGSLILPMSGRSLGKEFLSLPPAQWRGERLFFAGACLFAYLVALSLERWCVAKPRVVTGLLLFAVFAGGVLGNFRANPFKDYAWAKYAPTVDQWSRARRSNKLVAGFDIPINPATWITFPAYRPTSTSTGRTPSKVGIFRGGFLWVLDTDGNEKLEQPPDKVFAYGGAPGDIPVTGDWSGSGQTDIGIYRPTNGLFLLDYDGDGKFTKSDHIFNLQTGLQPGDIPVSGDWNGDGKTKVGLFRQGHIWLLDYNGDGVFQEGTDKTYDFGGEPGDIPVAGDWDGSGRDKVGVVRKGFLWVLDTDGNGRFDQHDLTFHFGGLPGDIPIVGDWNGDGRSKPGLFRKGDWILDRDGRHHYQESGLAFRFGLNTDRPIVGKW